MKPEQPAKRGDWGSFLGHRVRVHSGGVPVTDESIVAEGEVIAVCEVPTLTVRADDGTLTHHSSSLPIDVQAWHRA